MSKPRLLDAYTPESNIIVVSNPDYAMTIGWSDNNPESENRLGYFVSKDLTRSDNSIVKSTKDSKVLGVTVESPGFSTDVDKSMYDECGVLLPKYSYVCISGSAVVVDNGTCTVNGVCVPSDDGTAVPSTNEYGYRVLNRLDDNHITIFIESQGDIIPKICPRVEGSILHIW